jgi:ABC-type bacteriocin/lantibiotic exporter with double-glycine peptidase domain
MQIPYLIGLAFQANICSFLLILFAFVYRLLRTRWFIRMWPVVQISAGLNAVEKVADKRCKFRPLRSDGVS